MENEIWKQLDTCDLYKNILNHSISSLGRLKYPGGRISKSTGGKKRYHQVCLKFNNKKRLNTAIHIIVANVFLKNEKKEKQKYYPTIKLEVNHIDGDKKNNKKDNLEWLTHSENMNHAISEGLIDKNNRIKSASMPIIYINENNEETKYESINVAGDKLKVSRGTISSILTGKRKKGILNRRNGLGKIYLNFKYYEESSEDEQWKDCSNINKNFKHILVSSLGNIKNINTNRILKGYSDKRYRRVKLKNSSEYISTSVHRLVATLFIPNPENKPNVNHKDSNSFNNNVINLEWCTQQENCIHAHQMGLCNNDNQKRDYYKLELDGKIIEKITGAAGSIVMVACSYSNESFKTKVFSHNGYGYCHVEDYKDPVINQSLLKIFPNIDINDEINYDKLRPYIINNSRPIWKINKETGERVKKYSNVNDAMVDLKINTKIPTIYSSIHTKLCSYGYLWDWVDYKDILNPTDNYIRRKPIYIKGSELSDEYIIKKMNLDINKKPDLDLIRRNFQKSNNFRQIPVWKIDIDGIRIQKYDNIYDAEQQNNMGRNTISGVVNGKYLSSNCNINNEKIEYIWEFATIYKIDDDNYRIIPLSDRRYLKRKVGRNREYKIKQYDIKHNLIKIWNSRIDINNEFKIKISMSDNYIHIDNHKYIFEYFIE